MKGLTLILGRLEVARMIRADEPPALEFRSTPLLYRTTATALLCATWYQV